MAEPAKKRAARIFISYSRADAAHLTALETHLSTLKRQKLIEAWTDRALEPGATWSPELLSALRSADIVLLLVTPDFMASDYIHDVELAETFARHARGEVRVIPILVRPTDLKGDRLDTLQGLPKDRRPVTKWSDPDDAWLDVVSGLRRVLEATRQRSEASAARPPHPAPAHPDAWWESPTFAKQPVQERIARLLELGEDGDPRLGMHNSDRWVWIKPGTFMMGSNDNDREKPPHKVTLTRGFWMGRYPVINGEFKGFIEAEGYDDPTWWQDEESRVWRQKARLIVASALRDNQWNAPNQPVVGVSWYEARAFCRWQSAQLDQQKPSFWQPGSVLRLPTEAQWEYAARGSGGRWYPWGTIDPTPEHANFRHNIGRTSPVGAFPLGNTPETGLCDMSGNVLEWCADWYGPYDTAQRTDPVGPGNASSRVLRGAGWSADAGRLRAAARTFAASAHRDGFLGFRVVAVSGNSPNT